MINRKFVIAFFAIFILSTTTHAATLTIACYNDYQPYSYMNDDGNNVGILIDFWTLWANKNSVDLTFIPGNLTQCLNRIRDGQADIMIGLFRSDERAEYLGFSNQMIEIQTNLYVARKSGINSLEALGDIQIGVIENDYVVEFLSSQYPTVKLKTFKGSEQVVKNAISGSISAYALDFPNAIFLLAKHDSLVEFRMIKSLYKEKLRAGVKKENTELINFINQGIDEISQKEIEKILNKWGVPSQPNIVKYRSWIIGVVIILLAICASFVLYSLKLKSKMQNLRIGIKPFQKEDWLDLINQGENDWVEFKSSLRWNLKIQKVDKVLESVINKTISAFMNSKGGTLFIGVDDQGDLLGIEPDYLSLQKKSNRDGFLLKLSGLISNNLGRQSHEYIVTEIRSFNNKDICRITIKPGDQPVYLKEKGNEAFYIRAGASSIPLSLSESHAYINSRWL